MFNTLLILLLVLVIFMKTFENFYMKLDDETNCKQFQFPEKRQINNEVEITGNDTTYNFVYEGSLDKSSKPNCSSHLNDYKDNTKKLSNPLMSSDVFYNMHKTCPNTSPLFYKY